jgi:hypothetical protein
MTRVVVLLVFILKLVPCTGNVAVLHHCRDVQRCAPQEPRVLIMDDIIFKEFTLSML